MALEKKDIDHLAMLARIEISESEKEKVLHDLKGILGYVEKLRNVNTEGVVPMAGGSQNINQYRSDEGHVCVPTPAEELRAAFPEKEGERLKTPAVFG
ncbi:MAG: Asp-tRNA(Asn)/Glu-tRNA(Gln) amidotransferase subunit GatC [Nanoarchaeota archaeon]|nr:Asp-tRNA(Asn)/Glu-tRNA(Gln) amidotransferase subunit GatC [Nanoarchaeota archaeon]